MEAHSRVNSVLGKRLRNFLRITLFMMRKGLISKRKLIMDMNLMMKRGKLLRKTWGNLMSTHHHSRSMARGSLGIQEYEFSCSNSPNPVFFHLPKRKHHYFPCINPPEDIEEEAEEDAKAVVLLPKTPEFTVNFPFETTSELAPADKPSSLLLSPFSVRVSNYSSEEEMDVGGNRQVDDEAEEFIRRFYEQLRAQSRIQLLQSQEMLAGETP